MTLIDEGIEILSEQQCRELLATRSFGRVVLTTGALPIVLPVNYKMVGGDIVFFSGAGSKLIAAARRAMVGFQIDHVDLTARSGWSVLAIGALTEAPHDVGERARALGCAPFAPGDRHHPLRIRPDCMSGRARACTCG